MTSELWLSISLLVLVVVVLSLLLMALNRLVWRAVDRLLE